MYVVVVHDITDPEKFWGTVQNAIAAGGIPEGIKVHACYPDPNGTRALCVQEADSVDHVQHFTEGTFGSASNNQYFEVAAHNGFAVGLPH